jgi:hypothetical protein
LPQRLPTVGGDPNSWGTVLNGFLGVAHNTDGTLITSAVSTAGAEMTTNKGAASGYAPLNGSSQVPIANLPTGTTASTVAIGNDSRITGALQSGATAGGDLTGTLPSPTLSGTANVESIIRANTLNQLGTPTANLDIGSNRLINVASGINATDAANVGQLGGGVYGDGSDGAGTLDGTTTVVGMVPAGGALYFASRDLYFTNLTINSGITIGMLGFRLFVSGTLTGPGSILGGSFLGYPSGTVAGGAAVVTGTALAGANGTNVIFGLGGAGGAGGLGGGSHAGGSGGTVTAPPAGLGTLRHLPAAISGMLSSAAAPTSTITGVTTANPGIVTSNGHGLQVGQTVVISGVLGATQANGVWLISVVTTNTFTIFNANVSGTYTSGGTWTLPVGSPIPLAGGGSGGAGGGNATAIGGNGSVGGGVVIVVARYIATVNAAIISSFNGNMDGKAATGSGNAGGGGGGGGGVLIIVSTTTSGLVVGTGAGQVNSRGGAGGAAIGTGVAGTAGSTGTVILIPTA